MKLIILIGQRVRSGTNFLGSTLSQHPDVQTIPPNSSHGELNLFRDRSIEGTLNNISAKSFGVNYTPLEFETFFHNYGKLVMDQLIDKYELDLSKAIFIKTPFIQNYDLWLKTFPQAKFLFLCRDGRDNVISSVKAGNDRRSWHNFKIRLIKKINYYSGRSFINHTKDWKKTAQIFLSVPDQAHILKIKYEDLINNFENISQLLNFLNLNNDKAIINHCIEAPVVGSSFGFSKDKLSKPNWVPKTDKSKFTFTQKWKHWTILQKVIFNSIASNELKKLDF